MVADRNKHAFKDGRVEILKCVTPGCYWVRCRGCRGTSRYPEACEDAPFPSDCRLLDGTEVFARDLDGYFQYGCVAGSHLVGTPPRHKYVVKLQPTFQVQTFELCDLYRYRPSQLRSSRVSSGSAHLVTLFGALPADLPHNFTSESDLRNTACIEFEKKLLAWHQSNGQVNEILRQNKPLTFTTISTRRHFKFGILSYSGDVNFVDILEANNLAIQDAFSFASTFEFLIGLDLARHVEFLSVQCEEKVPDVEVETVSPPTNLHNPQPNLMSYDYDATLQDFIDEGGLLENACSLSDCLVERPSTVKIFEDKAHSCQVTQLREWQKVCLPSMLNKKCVFVVGPEHSKKMTTALLSAAAQMTTDCGTESVSPKFVVFVPNYDRGRFCDKIASDIFNNKIFVSIPNVFNESIKEIALEGCDILITTPESWLKLASSCKYNFKSSTHILFDNYEMLSAQYTTELPEITKEVADRATKGDLQTIILSNNWGLSVAEFVNLLNDPVVCATDNVEAAFCKGLSPQIILQSGDWAKEWLSVIETKFSGLRLLLCENKREIKHITSHLTSFLFISENQPEDRILQVVKLWVTNKLFLVTTDEVFRKFNLTSTADVLISAPLPDTKRETLIRRFRAISGHSRQSLCNVSVYLAVKAKNIEDFQFLDRLIPNAKESGANYETILSTTLNEWENHKTTNICPNVCMFGSCKNSLHCPLRHVIVPADHVSSPKRDYFFKFRLEKFHNIFHFSGRVEASVTNEVDKKTNKSGIHSNLRTINKNLISAAQFRQHLGRVEVDDILGAVADNSLDRLPLVRVKVLNINFPKFRVSLIDYDEPELTVHFRDLFQISDAMKKYPPDLVEVFMSNLLPVNLSADWVNQPSSYYRDYMLRVRNAKCKVMEPKGKKLQLLVGVVEGVWNRNVFVKSAHWYWPGANYLVESCFREVMVLSGHVVANENHLSGQLSRLALNSGKPPLGRNLNGLFGYRTSLPVGECTAGVIAFDDPGLFFIQLAEELTELENFEMELNAALNESHVPLTVFALDEICAVRMRDEWNRATILSIEDGYLGEPSERQRALVAVILCVDYGETRSVRLSDLFQLPNLRFPPYFAIECQLDGVVPFEGTEWSSEAVVQFQNIVHHPDSTMRTLTAEFRGVANENKLTRFRRHRVTLRDPSPDATATSVGQSLVDGATARFKEAQPEGGGSAVSPPNAETVLNDTVKF